MVKKVNTIQTTNTSNLVKKADYDVKINEIEKKILDRDHNKYITTQEFNKLTSENFAVRFQQAKLATKAKAADFAKRDRF